MCMAMTFNEPHINHRVVLDLSSCLNLQELSINGMRRWQDVTLPSDLAILECGDCELTDATFPHLAAHPTLYKVDASRNRLTTLPSLPLTISDIICTNNQIMALPSMSPCYALLETLDCSGNRLARLPNDLTQCTKLVNLICASNELTMLPPMQFPLLEVLDCSNNRLSGRLDLLGCPALVSVKCSQNQLQNVAVLGYGTGEIIDAIDDGVRVIEMCDAEDVHVRVVFSIAMYDDEDVVDVQFLTSIHAD